MINFPSNPADGQIVSSGRKAWQWAAATGTWDLVSVPSPDADLVANAAGRAVEGMTRAEAARDAANTTGKVYASAAAGIAPVTGVANGQSFAVLAANLQSWDVYLNNAGVAQYLASSYTKAYLDGMLQRTSYQRWLYAMTDLGGKLAFGVTSTGRFVLGLGGDIVARITKNETDIAAQAAQFVRSSRGSGYAWMVMDAAKTKIALAVDRAGNLISKGRDVLAEIDAGKALANAVNAAIKSDGSDRAARLAWMDRSGRAPLKATRSGRILIWDRDVLTELDALNAAAVGLGVPSAARENAAYITAPFTDVAGKKQIKTIRRSDGKNVVLTTTGNNIGASLTGDNKVLFVSDASGSWVQSYAPADGGPVYPTFSIPDLACWGDSLTQGSGSTGGSSYPAQLISLLGGGRSYYNGGIGGQNTASIAARQGGAPALLTVSGNQIPASGAVAVTARSVDPITSQGVQSFTGTLAGIPGTLARAADDSYSFTRLTAGSAVACPPATPFVLDVAVQNRGWTALIVAGRNDSMASDPAALVAALTSMVAYLTPYYKNFLVGLILNGTTERIGNADYNSIIARNNAVKAAFPNNFVDTQSPPTVDEMATLGFVPDATDNADIAAGCIPTHMRNFGASDTLHLNNFGYALWALRFKNAILQKGW